MAQPARKQDDTRALLQRMRDDPVWFHTEILGRKPWAKQAEILYAIRDNPRVAVKSCHGSGKTWLMAGAALWFLITRPNSIVATTAPTDRQVRKALWGEIRNAVHAAKVPFISKDEAKLYQKELRLDEKWYAFGFTADNPDAVHGIHADEVMVIVDEAPGINPELWPALESLLMNDNCRLAMIGNPTVADGFFYEEFTKNLPERAKFTISAFDTPNVSSKRTVIKGLVTKDYVERTRKRYGEESPVYLARVLGEFPEEGADNLISLRWIERAYTEERHDTWRHLDEPNRLSVDVARFGDAETVVAHRTGNTVRILDSWQGRDTTFTTGRVISWLRDTGAAEVVVDDVGIGGAVTDVLKQGGYPHTAFNGAHRPSSDTPDGPRFYNRRAEGYWLLRQAFQNDEIAIDDDVDLHGQLTGLKYRYRMEDRIQIEGKDDMRKRGVSSPDRADAVMMAWYDPKPKLPFRRFKLRGL